MSTHVRSSISFHCSYWQRRFDRKETRYCNVFIILSRKTSLVLESHLVELLDFVGIKSFQLPSGDGYLVTGQAPRL